MRYGYEILFAIGLLLVAVFIAKLDSLLGIVLIGVLILYVIGIMVMAKKPIKPPSKTAIKHKQHSTPVITHSDGVMTRVETIKTPNMVKKYQYLPKKFQKNQPKFKKHGY